MELEKVEVNEAEKFNSKDILYLLMYFLLLFTPVLDFIYFPIDFLAKHIDFLKVIYENPEGIGMIRDIIIFGILIILGIKIYWLEIKVGLFKLKERGIGRIFLLLLTFIGLLILQGIFMNLIGEFIGNPPSANEESIDSMAAAFPIITNILSVIIGPFVEEIVFRHILIGRISTIIPIYIVVPITTIIFAFIHTGFTMVFFIYLIMSIFFTIIYLMYKKNFVISYIYHFINNGIASLA